MRPTVQQQCSRLKYQKRQKKKRTQRKWQRKWTKKNYNSQLVVVAYDVVVVGASSSSLSVGVGIEFWYATTATPFCMQVIWRATQMCVRVWVCACMSVRVCNFYLPTFIIFYFYTHFVCLCSSSRHAASSHAPFPSAPSTIERVKVNCRESVCWGRGLVVFTHTHAHIHTLMCVGRKIAFNFEWVFHAASKETNQRRHATHNGIRLSRLHKQLPPTPAAPPNPTPTSTTTSIPSRVSTLIHSCKSIAQT